MRRRLLIGGYVLAVGLGTSLAAAAPASADCSNGTVASLFGEACAGDQSASGLQTPTLVIPGNVGGSPGSPFLYVEGKPCNSARWANCMAWIQNPSPS